MHYPAPDVVGAVLAAREYGVEIILVGDEAIDRARAGGTEPGGLPIRIVHAPEMLTMEDKGEDLTLKARHRQAQNSMAVGMDLVKSGEADAFVTAGNTGAAMVTALAPPGPTARRGPTGGRSGFPDRHRLLRGAGHRRKSRLQT